MNNNDNTPPPAPDSVAALREKILNLFVAMGIPVSASESLDALCAKASRADTLAADLAAARTELREHYKTKHLHCIDCGAVFGPDQKDELRHHQRVTARHRAYDDEQTITAMRADLAAAVARADAAEKRARDQFTATFASLREQLGSDLGAGGGLVGIINGIDSLREGRDAARDELRQLREAPVPAAVEAWRKKVRHYVDASTGNWVAQPSAINEAVALMTRAAAPPQPVPVATDAAVEAAIRDYRKKVRDEAFSECADEDNPVEDAAEQHSYEALCSLFRQRTAPPQPSSGNQRAIEELRSIVAWATSQKMHGGFNWQDSMTYLSERVDKRIAALEAEQHTAPVPQPQKPEATRAPVMLRYELRGLDDAVQLLPTLTTGDHTYVNRGSVLRLIRDAFARLDKPAPLQADAAGTAVLDDPLAEARSIAWNDHDLCKLDDVQDFLDGMALDHDDSQHRETLRRVRSKLGRGDQS